MKKDYLPWQVVPMYQIYLGLLVFIVAIATAAASAASALTALLFCATGHAIGTADTFLAAFLSLDYVKDCAAYYQYDGNNSYNVGKCHNNLP